MKPLVSLLMTFTLVDTGLAYTLNDTDRLMSHLMDGYNKYVRPMENQDDVLKVNISFTISNIKDFDEVKGKLTIVGALELQWFDYRLTWDFGKYNQLYFTSLPSNWVWKPSFHLENSADYIKTIDPEWMNVIYVFTGLAIWHPRDIFEISCPVDVRYYPFDTQSCLLYFISDVHLSKELQFFATSDKVLKSYYFINGEWELVDTQASVNDTGLSMLIAELVLKRRPVFVFVNVVLPMFVIGFLNPFVFALPSDSGERISYAVTILLSLAVFLTIVSSNIPRTSTPMSIMSYCIGGQIVLSCAILIATIFNLQLFHKGVNDPVPSWLTCFCRPANIRTSDRGSMANKQLGKQTPSQCTICETKNIDHTLNADPKEDYDLEDSSNMDDDEMTWKKVSFAVDKILFVISFILFMSDVFTFVILVIVQ